MLGLSIFSMSSRTIQSVVVHYGNEKFWKINTIHVYIAKEYSHNINIYISTVAY